jgi:phosphatidylglycerol:prolipoprotein diacylglycerol transferase
MMLLGLVCGLGATLYRTRQAGLDADTVLSMAFWMIVTGIVGARIFFIVQYWPSFARDTVAATLVEMMRFTEGGLVVYGSLLGALAAFVVFTTRHRLPVWKLADAITPGMVLGLAIGRIGCLFNGCCYGAVAPECPLAIPFPRYTSEVECKLSPPYLHQLTAGQLHGIRVRDGAAGPEVAWVLPGGKASEAGLAAGVRVRSINGSPIRTLGDARMALEQSGPTIRLGTQDGRVYRWSIGELPAHSLPVHPTQLYSALNAAILLFFLWSFFPFRPFDGAVLACTLTIYPVTRFLLEMIRDDEPGRLGTTLTISQIVSLGILACGLGLWVYLVRQGARLRNSRPANTARANPAS